MRLSTGSGEEQIGDRPDPSVPEIIADKYKILRRLGGGGMGEVYEAEHLRLGRHFAVKFIRRGGAVSGSAVRRFEREARAVARVDNEHVVSVLDYGEALGGIPYLVMELLRGEDLRHLLTRVGPLPALRACNIVMDACRGASAIHAAGVIHRDLKPENLFVSSRCTGEDLCKVLDFGIVRTDDTTSTEPDGLIGTIRYMAPEQLTKGAALTPAADVYALGVILFECLAGRPPFAADTVQQLMFQILNEAPPSLEAVPFLPGALDEAVRRAMSKVPDERFASAGGFCRAIASALQSAGRTPPTESTGEHGTARMGSPTASLRRKSPMIRRLTIGLALTISFAFGAWIGRGEQARAVAARGVSPTSIAPAPSQVAPPHESWAQSNGRSDPGNGDSRFVTVLHDFARERRATGTETATRSPSLPRAERKEARSSAPGGPGQHVSALFDAENPYDGRR